MSNRTTTPPQTVSTTSVHPGTEPVAAPGSAPAARAAAALCCVAGVIHFVVAPEHFGEWAPAGVFFVVVAAGQLWLGRALWRGLDAARLVPAGVLLTSGLVALYVVSRTIGLPFHTDAAGEGVGLGGSHHGGSQVPGGQGNGIPIIPGSDTAGVETVGLLDLTCVVAELGALALLVGMLPATQRRSVGNLLLAVGVCGWLVWGLVRFT